MPDAAPMIYQYYGLWIQTSAILVSGIGVLITMSVQRGIARRRATLDFIVLQQTNTALTEQRREFVELREKGNLEQWATKANLASREATVIRAVLNTYELVAIGIVEKTMDEDLYKRWYRTSVVEDWMTVKAFVGVYQRAHNPKLFCEFEALARKWATNDEGKHV